MAIRSPAIMNAKSMKRINIILFFVIIFSITDFFYANAENKIQFNLNGLQWQILEDSGKQGDSRCSVEKLNGNNVKLNYDLKKTNYWPWPEVDFFVDFGSTQDLTKYEGIQLNIKGKLNEEIYFVLLVEDKNLKIMKPVVHRVLLTDRIQKINLSFSNFKIAQDWAPRHNGLNKLIEWNKVKRFGVHKKGRDGEKGSISIRRIVFLQKMPKDIFDIEHIRTREPRYSSIDLKAYSPDTKEAEIVIYDNQLPQNNKIISPYLYGASFGTWLGLPNKDKIISLNLRLVRFGGPFVDRANWRTNKYTLAPNQEHISMTSLDDFIIFCRQIGAEPLIQINALGYAPDEKNEDKFSRCITPKDAADLVTYLNKEKKYNIKFFEIGNEPFIWHKVHFDARGKPCSIDEYFDIFKTYSMAMKSAQNKVSSALDIKIFGPVINTSYINWSTLAKEDKGIAVIPYFLKKCREFENNKKDNPEGFRILDVLSFHLFPSFRDSKSQNISMDTSMIIQSVQNWWNVSYINRYDYSLPMKTVSEVLPKFNRWVEMNYPGTELAVTEFNVESDSMVSYDPLVKALYLADLYGIFAKYGLNYAAQFCLNSSDQNIALIDDTDNVTPLYYPLSLYAKYFKGTILNSNSSLPEKLNVYACSNEGYITIMVINKGAKKYTSKIIIKNDKVNKNMLSFTYNFPALSLTCIRVSANEGSNLAECWEYGREQINRDLNNCSYL